MAKVWLNINKKTALFIFVAVFLLGLDRYLKSLALANFSHKILSGWLQFSFVPNYGIAFSLPLGGVLLNSLIFAILFGLLIWGVRLFKEGNLGQLYVLLFLFAGAGSNLWDRLSHGYVIDYLDLRFFTVFNLADVMIVLGVLCLLLTEAKKTS